MQKVQYGFFNKNQLDCISFPNTKELMKIQELQNANHDHLSFQMIEIEHKSVYDFTSIHRHDYFEIILFEKGGTGSQLIDFQEYPIREKSLYVVMPNQVHLMKRKREENGIIIQFTKEFLQASLLPVQNDFMKMLRKNPYTQLNLEHFDLLYNGFTQLKELYFSGGEYKMHQIRHLFAYVFFQILDILPQKAESSKHDALVDRFIDMAESNFKQMRLVAEYAKMLNVSLSKLNSELKEKMGKTPLQIIHELLALEIKSMLLVEDLTHKEISYQLNFDSQSSYSRFVQKHLGCKPSELKEQLLNIHS
ncbi:AraC family transcriptional regulator [Marinifilum flexuosum]|uniref:AraC family transcriptional regulator n=1 Tax=Marinifilum flexuosum TaxID=1117708 RepID=UPI0024911B30|nr:helix-turn-helix transcriptional regulator [Marinifilum flexuosum]